MTPGIDIKIVPDKGLDKLYVRLHKGQELKKTYDVVIKNISKSMGLPPEIIRHIINQESANQNFAVSSKQAYGIAQVRKPTMDDMFKESKKLQTYKKKLAVEKAQGKKEGDSEYDYYAQKVKIFTPLNGIINTIYEGGAKYGKSKKEVQKTITSIRNLGIFLGPLNLYFGMSYLADCGNELTYRKATGKTDSDVNVLLAQQMSYNQGIWGHLARIKSLKGWSKIFTIPANPWSEKNRKGTPYVPFQTTDYGHKFIKYWMAKMVAKGKRYEVHSTRTLHLKMCLEAFKRSHDYVDLKKDGIQKYMKRSGYRQYLLREINMYSDILIDRITKGKLSAKQKASIKKLSDSFNVEENFVNQEIQDAIANIETTKGQLGKVQLLLKAHLKKGEGVKKSAIYNKETKRLSAIVKKRVKIFKSAEKSVITLERNRTQLQSRPQ